MKDKLRSTFKVMPFSAHYILPKICSQARENFRSCVEKSSEIETCNELYKKLKECVRKNEAKFLL